jgi:hypothetical protein
MTIIVAGISGERIYFAYDRLTVNSDYQRKDKDKVFQAGRTAIGLAGFFANFGSFRTYEQIKEDLIRILKRNSDPQATVDRYFLDYDAAFGPKYKGASLVQCIMGIPSPKPRIYLRPTAHQPGKIAQYGGIGYASLPELQRMQQRYTGAMDSDQLRFHLTRMVQEAKRIDRENFAKQPREHGLDLGGFGYAELSEEGLSVLRTTKNRTINPWAR